MEDAEEDLPNVQGEEMVEESENSEEDMEAEDEWENENIDEEEAQIGEEEEENEDILVVQNEPGICFCRIVCCAVFN